MRGGRLLRGLVISVVALASLAAMAGEADARRVYVHGPRPRARVVGGVVVAPHGWYGGVGLVGTRIVDQRGGPEQLEDGAGISLWGGIRFNERLAVELGWMGSLHNPAQASSGYYASTSYLILESFTADARIHLDRSGRFDPYLQGGLGLYLLGREQLGIDAVGTGFQLGGGFDYWIGETWTLGLRARYHGISMGPPDCAGCTDHTYVSAVTAEASLGLHF